MKTGLVSIEFALDIASINAQRARTGAEAHPPDPWTARCRVVFEPGTSGGGSVEVDVIKMDRLGSPFWSHVDDDHWVDGPSGRSYFSLSKEDVAAFAFHRLAELAMERDQFAKMVSTAGEATVLHLGVL